MTLYTRGVEPWAPQSPGFYPGAWSPPEKKWAPGVYTYIVFIYMCIYIQYIITYVNIMMYICSSFYIYIQWLKKMHKYMKHWSPEPLSPLIWGLGALSPEPASEGSEPKKVAGSTPLLYTQIFRVPVCNKLIVQRNNDYIWEKNNQQM